MCLDQADTVLAGTGNTATQGITVGITVDLAAISMGRVGAGNLLSGGAEGVLMLTSLRHGHKLIYVERHAFNYMNILSNFTVSPGAGANPKDPDLVSSSAVPAGACVAS
jgi:hypothetical protein